MAMAAEDYGDNEDPTQLQGGALPPQLHAVTLDPIDPIDPWGGFAPLGRDPLTRFA